MLLGPQRAAPPMHRRAANDFANIRGKIWRILGNPPGSRSGPFIKPSQLCKRLSLIINMLLPFNPRSGLENQRANPLLCQFVSQRTTSSTRANNQHHATVIRIKLSWHKLKILSFDPIDVVEATMEIAALIIGRPFISEARPDRRVTVEVKDEVRPQPLKEGSLLDSLKCMDSCLFREASPRGPCLGVQSLDSVGEKSGRPGRAPPCRRVFGQHARKTRRERCYAGTWSGRWRRVVRRAQEGGDGICKLEKPPKQGR